jgi:hypothetical protein
MISPFPLTRVNKENVNVELLLATMAYLTSKQIRIDCLTEEMERDEGALSSPHIVIHIPHDQHVRRTNSNRCVCLFER